MGSDLNWRVGEKNREWIHIDTEQRVYLVTPEEYGIEEPIVEENPDCSWIFCGDNSVIKVFSGTEEEAREYIENWLAEHRQVSSMIS